MRRVRVPLVLMAVMLILAALAPVAGAGTSGDEPVRIDLFFTQLEPEFDGDGNLVSTPGGYFTMSGDGAVCDGGTFYDGFVSPPAEVDSDGFQTYLNVHDWKYFTCNSGETFTLEFWVEFELDFSQELDPFILVSSSWVVSESSIFGLTGSGTITYRNWDFGVYPTEETWTGVFGVYDCKKGGWQSLTDAFGTPFKNQGDCVSYFATDGRNLASG